MAQDLISMLSKPLPELRGYWLEETCCREPVLSPLWFHAARRPGWLLSYLAPQHTCHHCSAMPALALLTQDRFSMPIGAERVMLVDRFDEG